MFRKLHQQTYTTLIEDRWFGEGVRSQVEAFKEGLEEVIWSLLLLKL